MWEMHVVLETDRLVLRRFTMEDADVLFELDNDPDVMRYIDGGLPASRQGTVTVLVHNLSTRHPLRALISRQQPATKTQSQWDRSGEPRGQGIGPIRSFNPKVVGSIPTGPTENEPVVIGIRDAVTCRTLLNSCH